MSFIKPKLYTLFIIFCLGIGNTVFGQTNYESEFVVKEKLFGLSAVREPSSYKFTLTHADSSLHFKLVALKLPVFKLKFNETIFSAKINAFSSPTKADSVAANNRAEEIFFEVFSSLNLAKAPRAGVIMFNDSIEVYHNILKKKYIKLNRRERRLGKLKRPNKYIEKSEDLKEEWSAFDTLKSTLFEATRTFLVDSIEMEVLSGTIRNLMVSGRLIRKKMVSEDTSDLSESMLRFRQDTSTQTYRNVSPISISSLYDIKIMFKVVLRNAHNPFDSFDLDLRSIITYTPFLALKSDDYSPKDSVYRITRSKSGSLPEMQMFFKEDTKYLFVGKAFTDFSGFAENNPNGLIQSEVSKKIIINAQNRNYFHPFNYLEPKFVVSKIEDNLRQLDLNSEDLSGLNIHRFGYMSFATRLNLLSIDLPQFKFVFRWDLIGTAHWASIIRENATLSDNELFYSLEHSLSMEFRPDTRWTISFDFIMGRIRSLRSATELSGGRINTGTVDVSFRPNTNRFNEIFLRGSAVFDTSVNSFQRFQLGYAFPLIKTN